MSPANLIAWPTSSADPLSYPGPEPNAEPYEAQGVMIGGDALQELQQRLAAPAAPNAELLRTCQQRPLWKSAVNVRLPTTIRPQTPTRGFRCGCPEYDRWLAERALAEQRLSRSRSFVVTAGAQTAGYYTLVAGRLESALSGIGATPAAALRRLAVDLRWRRLGLGRSLVWDALRRIEQTAELLEIACLLAHPANATAQAFCAAVGFEPAVSDQNLWMARIEDVRRAVEA